MDAEQAEKAFQIEPLQAEHWEPVRAIYTQGIESRTATFETRVPTWQEWDASHLANGRLVARRAGQLLGWRPSLRCPTGAPIGEWRR